MYSVMVVLSVLLMKFLHRLMKCDKFSLDLVYSNVSHIFILFIESSIILHK